jgi:nucleotide-binding universal stress UspA family protein
MKVQLKNIICATDLSDLSNRAIAYGIGLAKEFEAKLLVCHVIDLSSAAVYGEGIAYPLNQQNRIINYTHEHLKELIGEPPVAWEPIIRIGHTADEIARVVEEKSADLVISATHGRSGLKRLILGSVAGRLMHTLSCPLLVFRSAEPDLVTTDQPFHLDRILVGCDFSPDSTLAFQFGLSLAQEFQSELHLVHVIEPAVYKNLVKPSREAEKESEHDLSEQLKERLGSMIPDEARHWCTPKTTLLAGYAHEELTKYAVVNKIDLIILGVRGHGLVETLFVGSTTDRVARQAQCPVLSVRPKGQTAQGASNN